MNLAKAKVTSTWDLDYKRRQDSPEEPRDSQDSDDIGNLLFKRMYQRTLKSGQKERTGDDLTRYLKEDNVDPAILKSKPSYEAKLSGDFSKLPSGALAWWKVSAKTFL